MIKNMRYQETTVINPDLYFIVLKTGTGNKNIIKFPVSGLTNSISQSYYTQYLYLYGLRDYGNNKNYCIKFLQPSRILLL